MAEFKIDTCRVCLQTESTKCVSLFDNYKEDVVSEHIKSIAAVEIDADDELPQGICPECLLQLDNALEFKRKCLLSDQILRNGALQQEFEINEEPIVEDKEVAINFNDPIKTIMEENESVSDDNVMTEHSETEDVVEEAIVEDKNDEINLNDFKTIKKGNESICDDNDMEHTEDAMEDTILTKRPSRAIDLKLKCDDCGETFKSKCKLKVHWNKAHLPEKLTCQSCKRTFKSYRAFNEHQKRRPRACLIASKVKVEYLGNKRIFHCTFCSYKIKDIFSMDAHLVTHTKEKRFQCNICGKRYSQLIGLLRHNESHHDSKNLIACYICGKLFKGRASVNEHIQRHIKDTSSKCTICNKVYKTKNTLAYHMLRHTDTKTFTCDTCGAVFNSNGELCTHMKRAHDLKHIDHRKFKCELCEFHTHTRKILQKHSSKHTDTNIPCLICGQFFDGVRKYNEHKKRHLENKYPCPECDKKYATSKSRNRHVQEKHRSNKGKKEDTDLKEESIEQD